MIYFYYGTDIEKARAKSHELVDSLRNKKPDASFFKIDAENFDITELEEYIGGKGLFSNKYIVFLDRLCEKKETKDLFVGKLKEIKESENIFIIFEGKLDKATAAKIEKKAEKTVILDLSDKDVATIKRKKEEGLNIFDIANALGEKNKKNLWIMYRQLIEEGKAPEEIHGVLFWKAKTMLLFGGDSHWKKDELLDLIDKLITVYHEARRGMHELETGLESLLVGIK